MSESMEVDSVSQVSKRSKTDITPSEIVILDDDETPTTEDNLKNDSKKQDSLISICDFIDLVKTELTANTKCINYACKSGVNMLEPPGFCLSYYRIKNKVKKRQQVCLECYEEAVTHYDTLVAAAKSNIPLSELKVPFRNDVVEIDDSDSDSEAEIVAADAEAIKMFEENFDKAMSDVLIKYNFNAQVHDSCESLIKDTDALADSFNEVKTMFDSIRSETDKMIFDMSNMMRSDNMELPPLNIVDRKAPVRRQPYKTTSPRATPQTTKPRSTASNSSPNLMLKSALQKQVVSNVPATLSPAQGATPPPIRPVAAANLSAASCSIVTGPPAPVRNEPNPESIVGLTGDIVIIPADLPPLGEIEKPPLKIGGMYYANRSEMIGAWMKVQLTDVVTAGSLKNGQVFSQTVYEISVENKQKGVVKKFVTGKEIAYSSPPGVQLDRGTRVIAVFRETTPAGEIKKTKKDSYYPGIVAEPLQPANKYRYLIFFDDGYAQYVSHNNVYLIYESNKNVWEDVNVNSRAFVKKYLENYDTRAMVRFLKDQTVRTEYNGKWWVTTVINVDCSLVQVFFDDISRIEWIYRGSTRFSPMFEQEQAAANRQQKQRFTRKPNNSGPYVEFTRSDGSATSGAPSGAILDTQQHQQQQQQQRSVARKSTSKPANNIASNMKPFLPADLEAPATKIVYYTPRRQKPKTNHFETHNCGPGCRDYIYCQLNRMKGYSPLAKPLLCGFYRLLYKVKHKKIVVYRAPCGRTLRNMAEVHRYLRLTRSDLTVDLFDFNVFVRCLAEFMVEAKSIILKDLSQGKEECPITVVNYMDSKLLDFCNYSTKRQPMEGVMLNLDSDFLVGCDCVDDCSDRSKCSCWKLTLGCLKYMDKDTDPEAVGYQYRRLPEHIFSGIYECNQRCKCASTCLNRVVQNPMQHKLQVFKTDSRGWGIRCLNDIPQGSFICIYAGSLLTEDIANNDGKSYGDEYLAELDFIETAEQTKEDYEEDPYHEELAKEKTPEPSDEEEPEEDHDNELDRLRERKEDYDFVPSSFVPKKGAPKEETGIRSRLRQRKKGDTKASGNKKEKKSEEKGKTDKEKNEKAKAKPSPPAEDDDTVMISDDEDYVPREPSSFIPKDEPADEDRRKYRSVREMFGSDEDVYIMDAKSTGNIGRFLNHSCSPNIFVQNVFVDTHDPRFPWVAFFTLSYVRAGTELTWNYNYNIGSVPGKALDCYCGSSECKGRLL